ncbi:hypothetical protein B296_00029050 [Ensete ventricosum]|uniref:Cullin family profile domain-containing protein n=1 Tax=Ensete ventricosum TaxID=4639 RepID=A0A427A8B6_ENSVE|nr:hypothetical protein B296_00029050 [Ensete ventricosum]
MVRWLSRFFHYLDRYFIARRSLPPLNEVGLTCFRDLQIDQEREGEQIDRALLKNVLDIFVEIGLGNMDCYENDFEADLLKDTAAYYSRKASNWILEDSCPDYMLKVFPIIIHMNIFNYLTVSVFDVLPACSDAYFINISGIINYAGREKGCGWPPRTGIATCRIFYVHLHLCDFSACYCFHHCCSPIVESICRKKLARRLLFDKSANDDHERSILTKLKQQCGGQFTSKMEGMVTDLTLARENQSSFEDYLNSNPHTNPGIDLTVTVLTTGFWPSYKSFDLNLPAEMVC